MFQKIQHYMNPLHVYCRLRDLGFSKETAVFLGRVYEKFLKLFQKTHDE